MFEKGEENMSRKFNIWTLTPIVSFLGLIFSHNLPASPMAARFALKCDLEMIQVDIEKEKKLAKDNSKTAVMTLLPTGSQNEHFAESDIIRFADHCEANAPKDCSRTNSHHGLILHAFVNPQGAIDIAAQILFFPDGINAVPEPVGAVKMTYGSSMDFLAPNAPEQTISYYNAYVIDPHLTSVRDLIARNYLRHLDLVRVTISKCEQISLDPRAPSRSVRGP
jgi:hypothetical protein